MSESVQQCSISCPAGPQARILQPALDTAHADKAHGDGLVGLIDAVFIYEGLIYNKNWIVVLWC